MLLTRSVLRDESVQLDTLAMFQPRGALWTMGETARPQRAAARPPGQSRARPASEQQHIPGFTLPGLRGGATAADPIE
jgi:hypothetical protein